MQCSHKEKNCVFQLHVLNHRHFSLMMWRDVTSADPGNYFLVSSDVVSNQEWLIYFTQRKHPWLCHGVQRLEQLSKDHVLIIQRNWCFVNDCCKWKEKGKKPTQLAWCCTLITFAAHGKWAQHFEQQQKWLLPKCMVWLVEQMFRARWFD